MGVIPKQFGLPQQGYSKEQVEWLENYYWNKTTSFLQKCKAVLKGNAKITTRNNIFGDIIMKEEPKKEPTTFGSKVKFALKFDAVALVFVLALVGAGEVKHKLRWQDAVAAENKAELRQMIDAADVKVPVPPAYPDTKLDKGKKQVIDWDRITDGG